MQVKSTSPNVSVFFGYKLNTRFTVGMAFDQHKYVQAEPYGNELKTTHQEFALRARYWMADSGKFRPYAIGGAGVVRKSDNYQYNWGDGYTVNYENQRQRPIFPVLQVGLGGRYELLRAVGIDLSLNFHKVLDRKQYRNPSLLFGQIGFDVVF